MIINSQAIFSGKITTACCDENLQEWSCQENLPKKLRMVSGKTILQKNLTFLLFELIPTLYLSYVNEARLKAGQNFAQINLAAE